MYDSRWQGQLTGWMGGFNLEDEVKHDFCLPWVVCEYEDVFQDELPGLPSYKDVDFTIELHLGTTLISLTLHRMVSVEL